MRIPDEELAYELQSSKRGRVGGRILEILGGLLIAVGVIAGCSIPLLVLGAVLAALGEWLRKRKRDDAGRQVFDAIAPELLHAAFENVTFSGEQRLVNVDGSDIPLPSHSSVVGSGTVRAAYRGLPLELCSVVLISVDELLREETGMWERNEHEVYTGQWLVCETGRAYPTGFTFWPRGKLDKLFRARTIKTGYEDFDKRFNLSCDNEEWVLQFLNPKRMECILRLTETAFSEFAVSLHCDGKLYIAAHSGRRFFDPDKKGRETPEMLRQRFSRELKWFTDTIDMFC